MFKLKIIKKVTAILANFSLLLNSFLPLIFTIQPAYANQPLSSNLEYNQSTNEFNLTVNTDQELSYQLLYKTDTQVESIVADNISQSPELSRQIYAGTCSENGVCTPHSIQQGILKVEVPGQDYIYSYLFKFNNNNFQIIHQEQASQYDLIDQEYEFLEGTLPSDSGQILAENIEIGEEEIIEEVPQLCLDQSQTITETINDDWSYDSEKDLYQSKDNVQLGVRYLFPEDDNVSVLFTCLPADPTLRSKLTIQRIKTNELDLPESNKEFADYAYDITTDMTDGHFQYELTLPADNNQEAEISYIEKSLEEAKENVEQQDLKVIEEEKIEQQSDKIKATQVDHFTIFIVRTYRKVNGNLVEEENFLPGQTVHARAVGIDLTKTKLRFRDPNGNLKKECESNFSLVSECKYKLPKNALAGQWSIDVGHRICIFWKCWYSWTDNADTFYVHRPSCGNDVIEFGEECDSSNLGGLPSSDFVCNKECKLELKEKKVTICHASNSHSNPYNQQNPNKSANVSGHDNHNGPIWYPGIADHSWGDIIPPFYYLGGYYPGKNWTPEGQAILNNDCDIPDTTLKIVKILDNTGGGTNTVDDFRFTQDGGSSYDYFESDGENEYTISPGSYSVSEFPDLDYNVSYDQCSGTINLGETKTCTITNTYIPYCGDATIYGSEECDDGINNTTTCTPDYGGSCNYCEADTCLSKTIVGSYCGDDIKDTPFEECDGSDGLIPHHACTDQCTLEYIPYCGDGEINQQSEECDGSDGVTEGLNFCTSTCKLIPIYDGDHSCPAGTTPIKVGDTHNIGSQNSSGINIPLLGGKQYLFKVYGTYNYANSSSKTADPAYATNNNWSSIRSDIGIWGTNRGVTSILGDLGSGMGVIEWDDDTQFNNDHIYQKAFNPQNDINVTFVISDWYEDWYGQYENQSGMGDNSGSLQFELYECQAYASVQGRKYNDVNGNGDFDNNEKNNTNRLDNWTINLYDSDWQLIDSMVTGDDTTSAGNVAKGQYRFVNIAPGQYFICEEEQLGWTQTEPSAQTGILYQEDYCHSITLTPGQDLTEIQFGNFKLASISGQKFNDLNGDGIKDLNEPGIEGWTINLDKDADGNIDNSVLTDSSGNYQFNNLAAGTYRVREADKDTWTQSTINPSDIIITSGSEVTDIDFGNIQLSKVVVYKFNDLNGNGQKDEGEDYLPNWMINLTGQTSTLTDTNGQVVFDGLIAGEYDLSEDITSQPGWTQTNIYCEDQGEGVLITSPGEAYGHHGACSGWNACGDAATCAQWACEVQGYQNLVSYGDQKPCTQFDNCHLFHSQGDIQYNWGNWCAVMGVTDIMCSNSSVERVVVNNLSSGSHLNLEPGQSKTCYIGNQLITPTATIAKSNDSAAFSLSPGDSIKYRIRLNILGNSVTGFKVTDLLSNGFKYQAGSYQVLKNGLDITSTIPEPEYHSPGDWLLGDLEAGDQLELVYTADVDQNQDSGKYTDLAWASGQAAYEDKEILATAESEGYIAENFVGTQVPVTNNDQDSVSAEVEQEEDSQGQVLGASTDELPATGSATFWLIISTILAIFGITLFKGGKLSTKMSKKLLLFIFLPLLFLSFYTKPIQAASDNLFVRLEEAESPTGDKDIELTFVALDILDRPVTAKCFKKDPDDSTFSQFGSDLILINGGDSDSCHLSSVINEEGLYQFKVTATADGDSADSQIVEIDYNTSAPGTPYDYHKEKINDCDFKIHFKTADDSQTTKVEIYRSTDSDFSANNDSLAHSINVGPDQEKTIDSSVSDCSKTYYYALRAFDNAGNGSGVVGDTIHIASSSQSSTETSTSSEDEESGQAIPVEDAGIPQEDQQEGYQAEEGSEEELSQETDQEGQVLGTKNINKESFFSQHKILSIFIAVALLLIITYAFVKIKQSRKK